MNTDEDIQRAEDGALERLYRRHHPAVLRVTQALLRHGADAQDAAQETFLKALQSAHGFRRQGPMKRWLLRIAANVAIDESRRQRPGTAGSVLAPAATPDPAVAAEAAEWERLLLRGLLDLAPEFREPLVLRYWDGCSLTEIADRLDIPRSTADKRCREGLDLLRQRLGPRGLKTLPLFLATLPKVAALFESVPLQGVIAGGVTLMVTKGIAAIAVVVVVLVCLPILLRDDASSDTVPAAPTIGGTREADGAGAGEAARGSGSESPPRAPIETREFSGASAKTDDAGGWRIAGRVLLAGKPAPVGTEVGVRIHPGWWEETWVRSGGALAEATVAVGKDGHFAWSTVPPEGSVTVVAHVALDGFVSDTETAVVTEDVPAPQELKLELRALDVAVTGVVRDRGGRPFPHPIVQCFREKVTGDEEGRYRVRGSSSFNNLRVRAWAEGFATTRETIDTPPPGGTAELDLVIDVGLVVAGRILDATGQPIGDAQVESWTARPRELLTPASGAYRLAGFARGERGSFEVGAPGYVRRHVWLEEIVEDLENHDVVLERGSQVRGIVVDESGTPIEGARIGVGHGFSMGGTLKTLTDRDGRFHVPDVKVGPTKVHVVRAGFVQLETQTVIPESGSPSQDLRLVLHPGQTLLGRVVDDAGEPVAGARVIAKKSGDYLEASTRTASDGTFDLEDVAGPEVGIEIYRRGLVRLRKRVPIEPDRIDIVVNRHGVLAGRVVDAQTSVPIDRFRIRIVPAAYEEGDRRAGGYSAELAERGRWFTKTEGRFVIDDEEIAPGVVMGLEASAEGYAPSAALRVHTTAKADPEALVFRLAHAAALQGTVLDAASQSPVVGARVRWRLADAPQATWYDFESEDADTVATDQQGKFQFEDLPPSPIRLEVDATGYPLFQEGPIAVPPPGGRIDRNVYLPRGAAIEGVVEEREGVPSPGARVSLSAADSAKNGARRHYNTVADAAGRFKFEGLASGEWRASRQQMLGRFGVHLYSKTIAVTGSNTYEVHLRPEGDASVRLTIQSPEPLPKGMIVSAIPVGHAKPGQTAIVVDATANFPAIQSGRWRFWAHLLGIQSQGPTGTLDLDLEPGKPRTATLEVKR